MNYLSSHGAKLLANGYRIIPIRHGLKHPGFDRWQAEPSDTLHLRKWLANGHSKSGVGIVTRDTPGVDIDVSDQLMSDKLAEWCEAHIGPTMRRVGREPRQLLLYRTEEPFPKTASKKYIDFLGHEHKVEILGDGQQFVAYAIHPDTKKPYRWLTDLEPINTAVDDLPTINWDQAKALVAYFESIVPADWEEATRAPSTKHVDLSLPEDERVLAHAKPKSSATSEELEKALSTIDPDLAMHDWVRVGMALHHQYDGGQEGFDIWDSWSAAGVKYNAKEMCSRWRSFKADLRSTNPATVASIFHLAKEARQQTEPKEETFTTADDEPEDETEVDDEDLLKHFRKRYVLIEHGNLVCDLTKPPHCAVSKLEEFRNATANVRHEVPAPTKTEPEKMKVQAVHASWLVSKERRTAQGVRYDPSKPFYFKDEAHKKLWWVNEFYMPEFPPSDASTEIFHKHMEYLFPIDAEREWFTDWMAFNLQRPGQRCKVTPLHVSVPHGTGRGFLVELMGALLGQWNCTKTKMETLCGDGGAGAFNDYLDKSLLCAVEEVREGSKRYGVSDKTRDILTENYLEVNVKYGAKKSQQVFTNFFLMSNHPDALVLTNEDRRINVFTGPSRPQSREYYIALYNWMTRDTIAALHQELMARDLSLFDWQHSMDTTARRQMIENNQSETETLFHEFISQPPFPAMLYSQIVAHLTAQAGGDLFDTNVEEKQLVKLLQHHAKASEKIRFGGREERPMRAWVFDESIYDDRGAIKEAVLKCDM